MVTEERLKELIHYDDKTGIFIRRVTVARRVKARAGQVLNCTQANGYTRVMIDGSSYLLHRLAFVYMGVKLHGQVDHINGDRKDNSFCNLRLVTHADNGRNTKLPITNKSGSIGICWDKANSKWLAQIKFNGENHFLGRFSDIELAKKARLNKEIEFGFHQNHGMR
jgi:hypothetical protein